MDNSAFGKQQAFELPFPQIIENLQEGLYVVDRDRVIRFWNRAAERISGFTAAEVVGRACHDNILTHIDCEGTNLCLTRCPLAKTITTGQNVEAEVFLHHKSGHRVPVLVRTTQLCDPEGRVIGGAELFTDISARQINEQRLKELEQLAMIDGLTRLANRSYVERELTARFAELQRLKVPFGLIFLDIDDFKQFNDSYGHEVGDKVLVYIASTLTASMRAFDLYGRWGGEEFVGVIRNIAATDLGQLAERIRQRIQSSYIEHGDSTLNVTASIGATVARPDENISALIKRADLLMYHSKGTGKNRVSTDDPTAPGEP